MKNPNLERCALVLKSNPFEPSSIIFLWTFAPWWSCCKSTPLLVMNLKLSVKVIVATPLWGKCEDETRTLKKWNLESSGTLENSELNCRGQNTSSWGVLYNIGKVSKFRCRKWPRMCDSNICNTSYGRKKGQESNCQFDSRPLKFGNRPDPGVCRWSATHRWKALEESYKFSLKLVSIGGLSWELGTLKVPGVETGTISGLHFGSPGKKSHLDVGATE
jgi:hypothetical protein